MRNLPIYFLILVFAGLMFALSRVQLYTPVVTAEPDAPAPVESDGFLGRMEMPSLDDIYVLENSAGRDIVQFEKFLKGRAASLHFASASYFKATRKNARKETNAFMGIKLSLDSTGLFTPEIMFTNVDDENFKGLVLSQIQTYWRYPRSEQGKFVAWVPFVWKNNY